MLRARAHRLQLGASRPGLVLTPLRPDGTPLPEDSALELRVLRTYGGGASTHVSTDGRARFSLVRLTSGARRSGWLVVDDVDRAERGRWRAPVTFDTPEDGEWLDLGVVIFQEEPLLVAGRVVLPDEVHHQDVTIEPLFLDGDGRWARVPDLGDNGVQVTEHGTFAIHGPSPEGPLRLSIRVDEQDKAYQFISIVPPRVTAGTRDLVVPLVRAGTLRFRIDGEFYGSDVLDVHVAPEGGAPRSLTVDEVDELYDEDEGVHVLRGLPPGRVTVVWTAEPGGAPLARIEGAVVRAGETTEAGTLGSLAELHWLELRVRSPSGEFGSAVVRYGPADMPMTWRAELSNGVARLGWDGVTPLDVAIGAHGCVPITLTNVRESREVVLVEKPLIEVSLVGLADLILARGRGAGEPALTLRFHPLDPGVALPELEFQRRWQTHVILEPDAARNGFEVVELAPGRYAVDAAVLPRSLASDTWVGAEHAVAFTLLGEFVVMSEPERQTTTLDVSALAR